MSASNLPVIIPSKRAWNRGRVIGQKRPLLPKHVWAIRVRLELAGGVRDLALFNLAIDSKLRGCDLVRLKVSDVFASGSIHISTRQYARLLKGWIKSIGLESSACGTHSMRRTKVAQIYKKTGNLRAVQLLLGHTKMDSTVRYLGVDLADALAISESVEI
nr:tyrosine-type recombinase/integrase [uncultured Cohaesibacter sp.]